MKLLSLLLLLTATMAFAAGPLYPTTPTAADLAAAARQKGGITFPGSLTKLRDVPVPPPATVDPTEALAVLEEKPFRVVPLAPPAVDSADEAVGVLEEKPFREVPLAPPAVDSADEAVEVLEEKPFRVVPLAPPAVDSAEALAVLEEKPFREVPLAPPAVDSADEAVVVLGEKPMRTLSMIPAMSVPSVFDLKLAFQWRPATSEYMRSLLKQIKEAEAAGDDEVYKQLTERYASWMQYETTTPDDYGP